MFLKKRSSIEDEHARDLRKLCRSTSENLHRPPDHRGGSFLFACDEMISIHDRMAENGMQFAQSLAQMCIEVNELAEHAERSLRNWKTSGLQAENRVALIEAAMRKSKAKYDALAEEYDRARTGDTRPSGKMRAFKIAKSAAQLEEDLLRKVQGADQAYFSQVQMLKSERDKLISTTRPDTVKNLRQIANETDATLSLHLQKFCMCLIASSFLLSYGVGWLTECPTKFISNLQREAYLGQRLDREPAQEP